MTTETTTDVRALYAEELERAQAILRERGEAQWAIVLGRLPMVESRRMVHTLGTAVFKLTDGDWVPVRIKLAVLVLERVPVDDARDVIRHEFAHVVAGKNAGHGPSWKHYAVALGARPEACTSKPAVVAVANKLRRERSPLTKYTFECARCGEALGSLIKRRRPTRWMSSRSHRGCGGQLVIADVETLS